MKRSTGWVAIAGVAVELATYAIASWVMGLPEPKALPSGGRSRRRVVYKRVVEHVPPHEYAHPAEPAPAPVPQPVPAATAPEPAVAAAAAAPPPESPPVPDAAVPPPPPAPASPAPAPSPEPPPAPSPLAAPRRPLPEPLLPGRIALEAVPASESASAQTFEPLPWQRNRLAAPPPPAPAASAPTPAPASPAPAPPRPPAPPPEPPAPLTAAPSFAVQSPIAPPAGPRFVAPPANELSPYLLEVAERTTQFNRAHAKAGWVTMAFYPDGAIRIVDTDGGRYQGRSENARAAMKQQQGSRTFDLHIGVSPDGRMQTTFAGGLHDGETVVLETVDAPTGQGRA